MLEILADRIYRHLFAAQVVALLGTGLATVALGYWPMICQATTRRFLQGDQSLAEDLRKAEQDAAWTGLALADASAPEWDVRWHSAHRH